MLLRSIKIGKTPQNKKYHTFVVGKQITSNSLNNFYYSNLNLFETKNQGYEHGDAPCF